MSLLLQGSTIPSADPKQTIERLLYFSRPDIIRLAAGDTARRLANWRATSARGDLVVAADPTSKAQRRLTPIRQKKIKHLKKDVWSRLQRPHRRTGKEHAALERWREDEERARELLHYDRYERRYDDDCWFD
jgi:hypothetical protein